MVADVNIFKERPARIDRVFSNRLIETGLSSIRYFAYLEMGNANPLNEQLQGTWAYETRQHFYIDAKLCSRLVAKCFLKHFFSSTLLVQPVAAYLLLWVHMVPSIYAIY